MAEPALNVGKAGARRIRLRGHVQGVGFRPFVYRLACELGVVGQVQNQLGEVEVIAAGAPADVERFTRAFAQHPPEWFVQTVLGKRLRPQAMVVGYDFRFGRARARDVDLLRKLGFKVFYGDASRHDLLHAAGAERARLLVLAIGIPVGLRGASLMRQGRGPKLIDRREAERPPRV